MLSVEPLALGEPILPLFGAGAIFVQRGFFAIFEATPSWIMRQSLGSPIPVRVLDSEGVSPISRFKFLRRIFVPARAYRWASTGRTHP